MLVLVDGIEWVCADRSLGLRVAMFAAFGKDGWTDNPTDQAGFEALKPTLRTPALLTLGKKQSIVHIGKPAQPDALYRRRHIPPVAHTAGSILRWACKTAGLYPTDDLHAMV